jgi:hypothetical protein
LSLVSSAATCTQVQKVKGAVSSVLQQSVSCRKHFRIDALCGLQGYAPNNKVILVCTHVAATQRLGTLDVVKARAAW